MKISEKNPKISIITCTYNGERVIEKYFENLFSQDYPLEKIELIIMDGGSTDKTLDVIKKYRGKFPENIKFFENKKQYSEGRGMGKDQASKKSKGEFLLFIDQDNILFQKDWLTKMVDILKSNKNLTGVQSRMAIPKKGSVTDKYLCGIGIEDPFAIPYSLNAQIILNQEKFKFDKKGYYVYTLNKKNFLYAGNNGFLIRQKDFFENKGYVQDIDNFYRMADKKLKIAIPKEIKIYHDTSTGFWHFLKKRNFYVQHYLLQNYDDRDFFWFDLNKNNFPQNFKFIKNVLFNILFIPGFFQGIKMSIKRKESFWLIHGFMLSTITWGYIHSFFKTKIIKKESIAQI